MITYCRFILPHPNFPLFSCDNLGLEHLSSCLLIGSVNFPFFNFFFYYTLHSSLSMFFLYFVHFFSLSLSSAVLSSTLLFSLLLCYLLLYSAYLRVARGVIDLGAFVLRLVLWIRYGSVSSVFLIKNLYNLLHTAAQIERWSGVWRYPKHTLFTEFVSPADWYGMTKEEWRVATSNTLVAQARAGRRV